MCCGDGVWSIVVKMVMNYCLKREPEKIFSLKLKKNINYIKLLLK